MKVVYIDVNGESQAESDCDGPNCEVRFPEGFMLLVGSYDEEHPECKLFCSETCLSNWKALNRT